MSILNASNENLPWTICFADDKELYAPNYLSTNRKSITFESKK